MRRKLLPILLVQCLIIITLLEGLGLNLYHTNLSEYYDSVQTINGIVKTVQIKNGYVAMNVDLGPENILLRLKNVSDEDYIFDMPGRMIRATGKITEPAAQRNPGCFDYRNYLRARNCYSIIEVSTFKFEPKEIRKPILHFLSVQKGLFFKSAKSMLDEKSFSLISGILFGEKGYMDDELYESFQTNGIAHVLAVSGLHVGLVYAVIEKLLKRKDILASLISLALLFAYIVLANFSISVIRAASMIGLKILAFHLHRRYDMLSAASIVAIIMLAINPYYIYDSGAQLSFLAAYSIAVLLPWFETRFKILCDRKKNEKLYKLGKVFLPGIVIQIGMAPLMAYHFLNYSILSILINPLAIYLASLLLPIGLICFLIYPFKIVFAGVLGLARINSLALIWLSNIADKLLSGFNICAPTFSLLALYYLLLFFSFSEMRFIFIRKSKDGIVVLINCALITIASCLPVLFGISQSFLPWKYNSYDYVFLDVGQGDAAHISSNGVNILIDGGGSIYKDIAKDTLKPYLLKNGIKTIDLAIVSHLDTDHSKGIADLSKQFKIKRIAFPISVKGEDLNDFLCDEIVFLDSGDKILFGNGNIDVLSGNGKDANSGSLVCSVNVNESTALFMADVPIEKEEELDFPDVDYLKVGHHGSKSSSSEKLLKEASPSIAVISCGKGNRYGHPTDRVLELLENSGIIIKRTDLEGAICIKNKNILTKQ